MGVIRKINYFALSGYPDYSYKVLIIAYFNDSQDSL